MRTPSRTEGSAPRAIGLAVGASAIVVLALVVPPESCRTGPVRPVGPLPRVTATATPVWDDPPPRVLARQGDPDRVEIHLDVSSPMAGYLPPSGDDDLSVFQHVAQNAAQHMARVFGDADALVRWVGVGHELRSLGARPRIERDVFDGRSTQLDESMARMLGDFRAGRAEAAALVSDLMATGDVTGPLTLFGALGEWLRPGDVRSGAFHVGLFGVKADYWGVRARGCAARRPLGCRFDELQRRWEPLETVEQLPVYVLVIGRDAERLRDVMDSLQETVNELNLGRDVPFETQRELLTRAAPGHETTVACQASAPGGGPQYSLYSNDQEEYSCGRDDIVTLTCDIEGGFQPSDGRATWVVPPAAGLAEATAAAEADTTREGDSDATTVPTVESETANGDDSFIADPPPDSDARIDGRKVVFDFSCAPLRFGPLARTALELRLEAAGTVPATETVDWRGWSTETGEVGRTLQLMGFVEAVRARIAPDRYELRTPALLRFPGR